MEILVDELHKQFPDDEDYNVALIEILRALRKRAGHADWATWSPVTELANLIAKGNLSDADVWRKAKQIQVLTGIPLNAQSLDRAKRIVVERALEASNGNVDRAAQKLGLTGRQVYRLIKQWALDDAAEVMKPIDSHERAIQMRAAAQKVINNE
jgi:DNA-binding NtrC family response regulator